jgi:hypothetical protein
LIEVIVSVLVIGIAFVPLMAGLNAALKTNKKTENELYAESVASNVVEICKTYGEYGFENTLTNAKINSLLTGAGAGIEISPIATDKLGIGFDAGFLISGISSGTEKSYKAKVEFSSISGAQNDFSGHKPLSGFLNAVILSVPAYQEEIVSHYSDITDRDETAKADLWTNASSWLRRDITVNINPVPEDTSKYTISIDVKYSISDETFFRVKSGTSANAKILEKEIIDNKKYALPLNPIVLSYRVPFSGSVSSDNLVINKTVSGNLKFNLLCGDKNSFYHLNVSGSGETTQASAGSGDFYQIDICVEDDADSSWILGRDQCDGPFSFSADSAGQSIMKDIKISIYDSLNDPFSGDPTVVKTTTMIEYEAVAVSGASTSGSGTPTGGSGGSGSGTPTGGSGGSL